MNAYETWPIVVTSIVLQALYTLALLTSTSYSSAVWVPSTHTETTPAEL